MFEYLYGHKYLKSTFLLVFATGRSTSWLASKRAVGPIEKMSSLKPISSNMPFNDDTNDYL